MNTRWQNSGMKPGEIIVITGGRNAGKSALLQKFLDGIEVYDTKGEDNMIHVTRDNIKNVLNKGDTILIDGQEREIDYCYWDYIDYDLGIELTKHIDKPSGLRSLTISCSEIELGTFSIYKVNGKEKNCPVEFETGMVVVEEKHDGQVLTGIVFKSEDEKDEDVIKYIDSDNGFNFLYHIENENLERKTLGITRTVMKVYKPSSNRFIPTNMEDFGKLRDGGFLNLVFDRETMESVKKVKSGDRLVDDLDGENLIISLDKGLLTLTSLHTGKKYIDNIAVLTNNPTMGTVRKVLKNSGFNVMSQMVSLK